LYRYKRERDGKTTGARRKKKKNKNGREK